MKTPTAYLKTSFTALAFCLAVIAGSVMVPHPVGAGSPCPSGTQEVGLPVDPGGTRCVPINQSSTNLADNPIFFYLRYIVAFLAGGVGLLVVGGIIFGAYLYITARGNAAQAQQGQTTILNAVIGLITFIFMYAILEFLIPGGVF